MLMTWWLQDHSLHVLHIFLMSRVFLPGGWRDNRDIGSWLAASYSPGANIFDTAAGPVELWLFDPNTAPPVGGWMYSNEVTETMEPRPAQSVMERRVSMELPSLDDAQTRAIDVLMHSEHARYTISGACTLVPRADGPQADMSPGELCGRSAVRCVERNFSGALADAEQLLQLDPVHVLGHACLAEALIGLQHFRQALKAVDQGLHLSPHSVQLQGLRDRALVLWRARSRPLSDETLERAMWNGATLVVDLEGNGDYSDLKLALSFCTANIPPANCSGWTLILRSGTYEQSMLDVRLDRPTPIRIQLLGEAQAGQLAPAVAILSSSAIDNDFMSCIYIAGSVSLYLDGIAFVVGRGVVGMTSHCIQTLHGAGVTARGCTFFAGPNMPCIGLEGAGTHAHISDCTFEPGCGAGVLLSDYSALLMERSELRSCNRAAVEIRGIDAVARLVDCSFEACRQQAVSMYNGGRLLEMVGCKVVKCGQNPQYAAVMLESGKAVFQQCILDRNEAQAIMVQGHNVKSPPHVTLEECTLSGNLSGIQFGLGGALGSGSLRGNTIIGQAANGVRVCGVCPEGQILIENNTFKDNGSMGGADIVCTDPYQAQVIDRNNKSTAVIVTPSLVSPSESVMIPGLLQNLWLRRGSNPHESNFISKKKKKKQQKHNRGRSRS
jgi:hypothetical protein